MRVQDIVSMNAKLVPKQSITITVGVLLLFNICLNFSYNTAAGIGAFISLVFAFIFLTMIPMNHIFNKSVFGEYAYQYMSIPISFNKLVKGKVLAAFNYCMISVLICILCVDFFIIHLFGAGGLISYNLLENSIVAFINMHEMFSDDWMLTETVMFIFGTIWIASMIEALFISSGAFYAVIIRNIIEPQREKVTIAIGIALAAVIIYIVFTLLCVWIPGLFFKNDLAIAQLIIAGALKAGAAYGIMVHSAKLLETKYSLN